MKKKAKIRIHSWDLGVDDQLSSINAAIKIPKGLTIFMYAEIAGTTHNLFAIDLVNAEDMAGGLNFFGPAIIVDKNVNIQKIAQQISDVINEMEFHSDKDAYEFMLSISRNEFVNNSVASFQRKLNDKLNFRSMN